MQLPVRLQDLELSFCDQIPTDAWEILQTANWSNLRKASFEQCFDDNTKGAEGAKHLLKALAQSAALEEHPLHWTALFVSTFRCLCRSLI
eukprot:g23090.t1